MDISFGPLSASAKEPSRCQKNVNILQLPKLPISILRVIFGGRDEYKSGLYRTATDTMTKGHFLMQLVADPSPCLL
jgi:hypothetical protein